MDQLTPAWIVLLAPFAGCFRREVFATFCLMFGGWIVCLGRRTVSRVWETTGRAASHCHCPAFRLFSPAGWNWDEVCRILLMRLLAALVPGTTLWIVVDDTLCHKRGAKVAFGGIFLDAVLSSKKHKIFRFGTNWVTLGLVVELPFRKDRFFCLNILWRVYAKKAKGKEKEHRTKSQRAREMVEVVAGWLPEHKLIVVGDSAYVGKHLLRDLPAGVEVIGPIHPKAVLSAPLPTGAAGRRKQGERLPSPQEMRADTRWEWRDLLLEHPKGEKRLRAKVVSNVCWYGSAGQRALQVVLLCDPEGLWREESLLCTDEALSVEEVVLGYTRRWSVEVAYGDSKQLLGFHDPQVWCAPSVERAHPMAWFSGAMVVLWYAEEGQQAEQAQRERPWYKHRVSPTFADMLACCRLHLWQNWLASAATPQEQEQRQQWLLNYLATAA